MNMIYASVTAKSVVGRVLVTLLFALNILLATGCSDALTSAEEGATADGRTLEAPDELVDEGAALLLEPTSAYDPSTGEPVAFNYDPAAHVYADELREEAIMASSAKGLGGGQSLNGFGIKSWGSLHSVQIGSCCQASGTIPEGYFLTGIGVRANGGGVTTLHLVGQEIESDGDLGQELTWKFGSNPNHALEVYGEVPPGHAIIGVGFRNVSGNVTTMKLWYREYDDSDEKLVGPTKKQVYGVASGLEVKYVHPQGDGRDFLTGIGVRDQNGNMKGLRVYYRWYGPWISG